METHFIFHDKADTVGVMVVENAAPGQELTGWIMETDETISLKALDAVPLGHKIALKEIKSGDTVLKYGHDVGRAVAAIGKGNHVLRTCNGRLTCCEALGHREFVMTKL